MNRNADHLIKAAREGGHVRRCHTVPHHGEYSVGKHSYDALSMLMILHPNPSMNLVKAVLWHDCAERFVGDMPAPAKWLNPSLEAQYEAAEVEAQQASGLVIPELTEEEQNWLDAVDRAELLLWTYDQMFLGNYHCQQFLTATTGWFEANQHRVPEPVLDFVANFRWTRLESDPRK